jgi:hypothetical protein
LSDQRVVVRATLTFFADLDRQLRAERGPNGEPSTNDFQAFELLEIVERFATGFWQLPELIPGRTDYGLLIATGQLVRAFSVVGQLALDGAVELSSLEIDTGNDWTSPCATRVSRSRPIQPRRTRYQRRHRRDRRRMGHTGADRRVTPQLSPERRGRPRFTTNVDADRPI